jgi:2',3'-cyclic-nucleotide 2'-phosphodiesterase/3'-nucleotidase
MNPNEPLSDSGEIVRIRVIGFSDLHGNFFPYDFLQRRPKTEGLPWIYQFVKEQREDTSQHVVLLNSGDFLQGSMSVYYHNYMDPRRDSFFMPLVFLSRVGVDVSVLGNHDLETGQMVTRRAQRMNVLFNSEIIAANVFAERSRQRSFKPYVILERGGLRIAVLGLTTPVMTGCAKTKVVTGLDIADMLPHARTWIDYIRTVEEPDLVIGLFHAGFIDRSRIDPATEACVNVNDPVYIAKNVPGFDGFILGHQHKLHVDSVLDVFDPEEKNHSDSEINRIQINGRPVWLIEPGYGGKNVGILDFEIQRNADGSSRILSSSASIQNVSGKPLPQDILDEFAEEQARIAEVANEIVAVIKDPRNWLGRLFRRPLPATSSDGAYFGPNFFVDITHKVQLDTIGINRILGPGDTVRELHPVDVSFASPLSSNITFTAGDTITFGDLLRIYRFENKLAIVKMTGKEIKDYLEYSYDLWTHQMQSPAGMFLRLNSNPDLPFLFENPAFNFDSGAGLDYEVDVSKRAGQRITILPKLWNGKPFHETDTFNVAVNSYRFSGAGGHMELGAKIKQSEMPSRLVWLYDVQVRRIIMSNFLKQQRENGGVELFQYDNWKFVPEEYVKPAIKRERQEIQQRRRR